MTPTETFNFNGSAWFGINDMKQYKLYWKSRRVLVRHGGNMLAPEYRTEWYLSEWP